MPSRKPNQNPKSDQNLNTTQRNTKQLNRSRLIGMIITFFFFFFVLYYWAREKGKKKKKKRLEEYERFEGRERAFINVWCCWGIDPLSFLALLPSPFLFTILIPIPSFSSPSSNYLSIVLWLLLSLLFLFFFLNFLIIVLLSQRERLWVLLWRFLYEIHSFFPTRGQKVAPQKERSFLFSASIIP